MPVEGRASNHFEIAFTESEFLIDFGQSYGKEDDALVHTRIIMTPRSAKTLGRMLQGILAEYETTVARLPEGTS